MAAVRRTGFTLKGRSVPPRTRHAFRSECILGRPGFQFFLLPHLLRVSRIECPTQRNQVILLLPRSTDFRENFGELTLNTWLVWLQALGLVKVSTQKRDMRN